MSEADWKTGQNEGKTGQNEGKTGQNVVFVSIKYNRFTTVPLKAFHYKEWNESLHLF